MERRRLPWAKLTAALLALSVVFPACLKTDEFPVEPNITFKSLEVFGDSASLTVSFTDGDGDIGLAPGDTFPPYDTLPYSFNLFVEYEELQNGVWTQVDLLLPLYYRIPVITPTGQNKTLEGDLSVALKPFPTVIGGAYDTVRYSVKLVDRALHESNVVWSDALVLD